MARFERIWSVGYSDSLDAAPPQFAGMLRTPVSPENSEARLKLDQIQEPERRLQELSGLAVDEFWRDADAEAVGLSKGELAEVLLVIGIKYNYGFPAETAATPSQIAAFWRELQLKDLALAHACALGRDAAWREFVARFREPLTQAATGITRSAQLGRELADSLYSELFGVVDGGVQRKSPLAYYSGRGSLKGFLRTTLAQRNVDRHRRTSRETPLADEDLAATPSATTISPDVLFHLRDALTAALRELAAEERFLLSSWFFDKRTLLDISRILQVHEATVSRRLQRLTERLHKDLLKKMQASGMSRAAAEEALGADPRDLDINLRSLLQSSQTEAFLQQGASANQEP